MDEETGGGPGDPDAGYVIGYSALSDNGESLEFFLGGYYRTAESAGRALKEIRRTERFQSVGSHLVVAPFDVNADAGWPEGFRTV